MLGITRRARWIALLLALAASPAGAADDAAIYALIDSLKPVVPNIGIPLGISNASVGLNPTTTDPWRRDVAPWGIREGFFVLPEPDADLVFVAGVALLAVLAQIRRVGASFAARAPRAARQRRRVRP